MASVLAGCSVSDSTIHTLSVSVRADADAPDDYGVRLGAMIAGAEVCLVDKTEPDVAVQDGRTNDSGRATFMVQAGNYRIHAARATSDPYCHWSGSTEVEINKHSAKDAPRYLGRL